MAVFMSVAGARVMVKKARIGRQSASHLINITVKSLAHAACLEKAEAARRRHFSLWRRRKTFLVAAHKLSSICDIHGATSCGSDAVALNFSPVFGGGSGGIYRNRH